VELRESSAELGLGRLSVGRIWTNLGKFGRIWEKLGKFGQSLANFEINSSELFAQSAKFERRNERAENIGQNTSACQRTKKRAKSKRS